MPIEVRPADQRPVTRAGGRSTRHSFSFGAHYDPHNVAFGAMLAHNDEVLPPGSGYPEHPHSDLEIVTWVLSGSLVHSDSSGRASVLGPGQVQRLSAGSGVVHAEFADAGGEETRFLQVWVRPDEAGLPPSYVARPADPVLLAGGRLVCLAAGPATREGALDAAVDIGARATSMHAAVLDQGVAVTLPDAPRLHVFVASGGLTLGDRLLGPGDAGRLVDEGGRSATATEPGTQLVVWGLP